MAYTSRQLADLAGVSVRTLHYYDEIGILKPGRKGENGYRYYGTDELNRLQQILFFRELDFSLSEIKEIIDRTDFDLLEALEKHKNLLDNRAERLKCLMEIVDKTILKLKGELTVSIKELYEGYSDEQIEKYRQEARDLFGHKRVEESEQRVQKLGRDDFRKVQEIGDDIFRSIHASMDEGYDSHEVQQQVKKLHEWLNNFYDCSYEILLGVGHMYNEHPDFVKMYKTKYHEDMPEFLLKAIELYCDNRN